jgi:sec-independent protein translocase protein TatB
MAAVDALTPAGDPTHGDVATLFKVDAMDFNRTQQIESANIASTELILSKRLPNPALRYVHRAKLNEPTFVSAAHGQLSLAFMSAHPPILLGTLGMTDTLILMVMALVVFGPRRLPQIGRQIGKLMYEFRKASNDFKFQMEEELRLSEEADRRKKEEERQRSLAALAAAEQASVSADPPAPAQTGASPYPGEGAYPAQYPPETPATTTEETAPRIMPPSIGETVAAPRPGRATEPLPEALSESTATTPTQPDTDAAQSGNSGSHSSDSAEALNQHG